MNHDKVKELLSDIGIDDIGKYKDNKYIIELDGSDEFARYYTLLDSFDKSTLRDEGSMAQEFATVLSYIVDDYKINLNANFTDDYYSCVISEVDKDE